jgi:tight adherence protein C
VTGTWSAIAAALATAVAVGGAVRLLVPPVPRLAPRVRPYVLAERAELGRTTGVDGFGAAGSRSWVLRLFGPPVAAVVRLIGRVIDESSEEHLALRLRQARLLADVPPARRTQEYRLRQVGSCGGWTAAAVAVSLVLGLSAGMAVLVAVGAAVVGATRWPARLDRAVEARRTRIRVELYTVNQLLAMNIRVGGGPIQAVQRVTERGRGEVVAELSEALSAHASGMRASEAFERIAQLTPEPAAGRTYRLLASAADLGADLAVALRTLSDDVRETRRDALRQRATRRRAAMLVPIIGILAPTMLLFIAAPIPSLIFGAR